ncbi:hypothetical protein LWI29_016338 [Acer saccharum]|uniref:Uncharacterized protein n=1 Tax=Acer saccharum TaxID=4024 RepID=A0AA39RWQ7_ACESA|nr:hypothetical protein LWI29_016338 [Acer saccharum]
MCKGFGAFEVTISRTELANPRSRKGAFGNCIVGNRPTQNDVAVFISLDSTYQNIHTTTENYRTVPIRVFCEKKTSLPLLVRRIKSRIRHHRKQRKQKQIDPQKRFSLSLNTQNTKTITGTFI